MIHAVNCQLIIWAFFFFFFSKLAGKSLNRISYTNQIFWPFICLAGEQGYRKGDSLTPETRATVTAGIQLSPFDCREECDVKCSR